MTPVCFFLENKATLLYCPQTMLDRLMGCRAEPEARLVSHGHGHEGGEGESCGPSPSQKHGWGWRSQG